VIQVDVGKIIKEKRSEKNMTQEDLADEFFVSRQLISKWENGKSYPDLEQLIKLSDFFDLTLDELMRGDKKMTKKFNTIIKRKPIMIGIISILTIAICFIGYSVWVEQNIQLTPSDIEIISIKIKEDPSIKMTNISTNELVTLPKDVSYTIKYKIKKPFTDMRTGYYLGQDEENLYVDMRGENSLFPSNKERTFVINSDSRELGNEDTVLEVDENYVPEIIKDKDIKILEINGWDGVFSHADSTTLIKKSELKK